MRLVDCCRCDIVGVWHCCWSCLGRCGAQVDLGTGMLAFITVIHKILVCIVECQDDKVCRATS